MGIAGLMLLEVDDTIFINKFPNAPFWCLVITIYNSDLNIPLTHGPLEYVVISLNKQLNSFNSLFLYISLCMYEIKFESLWICGRISRHCHLNHFFRPTAQFSPVSTVGRRCASLKTQLQHQMHFANTGPRNFIQLSNQDVMCWKSPF